MLDAEVVDLFDQTIELAAYRQQDGKYREKRPAAKRHLPCCHDFMDLNLGAT
jgi:hypothetical protein